MNDRTYGQSGSSGSSSRPSINPNQLSRHGSLATTSSSSSSNLSSLGALTDSSESGAEDPADASPLRSTVTRSDAKQNTQYATRPNYSAATVGLRSFSNTILSPAQRLAKDSLPSPPATSSERGSIGSAGTNNSQAGIERSGSVRMTRPSLPMASLQAETPSEDLANTPVSSTLRTARPSLQLDTPPLGNLTGTPSPMPRSTYVDVVSTLQRSRSRSPLAELREEALIQASQKRGVQEGHGTLPEDVSSPSLVVESPSMLGKSRDTSPAVSRSGSIRASTIRRTGEAARQRLYERAGLEDKYTQEDSAGAVLPSRLSSSSPNSNVSLSSSSTEAASRYESARSSAGDTPPTRVESSSSAGRNSLYRIDAEGSEAFARSNRNSVISLSNVPAPVDVMPSNRFVTRGSSRDVSSTLRDLDLSQELEEGEILDETEPNGIDGVASRAAMQERRSYQVELEEPSTAARQVEPSRMSRQSSGSGRSAQGDFNRDFAVESLRRSGLLSPSKSASSRKSDTTSTTGSESQNGHRRSATLSYRQGETSSQAMRQALSERSAPGAALRATGDRRSGEDSSSQYALPQAQTQSIVPKRSHTSLSIYSDSRSSRQFGSHGTPRRSERAGAQVGTGSVSSARHTRYTHSPERVAPNQVSSGRRTIDASRSAESEARNDRNGRYERQMATPDAPHSTSLPRSRTRTLSLRDEHSQNSPKRSPRMDVFADGTARETHRDKFQTIASSRPRTSASLRDLQVGSADWWQEVQVIRERTAGSTSGERPASRASHLDRHTAESPSPLLPERDRTVRRGGRSPQPDARSSVSRPESRLSRDESRYHASQGRSPVLAARAEASTSSTPSSARRLQQTPVEYSPSSRPISRSHTVHTSMSMRRLRNKDDGPYSERHLEPHQRLLENALHAFVEHSHQTANEANEAVWQQAQLLASNANRIGSHTKALLSLVVSHQVELELEGQSRGNASRDVSHASRIEGAVNLLSRLADDQIRSLTEMLLAMARRGREQGPLTNGKSDPLRGDDRTRRKRDETATPARERGADAMEKAQSSSARRQASSRLERIDSVTEVGPSPAHDRGRSDNATVLPLPSPRALRRAKSSSTSQVSQSTVVGVIASSPPKDSNYSDYNYGNRSGRRSSSVYSKRSDYNDIDDSARTTGSHAVVVSRSPPTTETPTRTGSRRWKPFGKAPFMNGTDLPDSPSIANQTRSSELSRTLSRFRK